MFRINAIAAVLFFTTLVNLFVLYTSWRRKNSIVGLYFSLGMIGIVLWSLGSTLDYASTTLPIKIIFSKIEAVGYLSAIPLFTLTSIAFAGNEHCLQKKWVKTLFTLIPLGCILIVLTNEWHGWMWSGYEPHANNIFVFTRGAAYEWMLPIYYLQMLFIVGNFIQAFRSGSGFARRQAFLMILATILPLAANVVYQFEFSNIEGLDWTSITFSISASIFLYALYGLKFLDVIHIARNAVLEQMNDAILVQDKMGRLADFNPPAGIIFGITNRDLWQPLKETALSNFPEVTALFGDGWDKNSHEIIIGTKTFDFRLTSLDHQRGIEYGQLLVLRDVSQRKEIEESLRASEKRFRQLIMAAPDAVFGVSEQGHITFANEEATRLLEYTLDEFVGMKVEQLVPLRVQKTHAAMRSIFHENPHVRILGQDLKLTVRNKSGNDIPVDIKLSHVVTDEGVLAVAFVHDIRERIEKDMKLHEAQKQVVEQQRELAKMEERRTLARDMHDSVNQSIHSLMLFSETLVALLQKNKIQEALEITQRIQQSGKEALKEIRLLLYKAQYPVAEQDMDLRSALEERLNMVERRVGIKSNISFDSDDIFKLPMPWKENLYWITMEALNNSLKYSHARNVSIEIRRSDAYMELSISDNGAGFDIGKVQAGGFGMRYMQERAALLGGMLSVTSTPGSGTQIRFRGEVKNDEAINQG
ncbi:MAG: histidine kinase N-terminal 7TM domain-containing protein [Anaerolineales bacterium]